MVEEILVRTISALLILNVLSLGLYLIIRGYYKYKSFSKMRRITGRVIKINRWLKATIAWYWRGQEVMATDPALFALRTRERIPLFISEDGTRFHLNIWTHNGIGLMVGGMLLSASALFIGIVLI